MLGCCDGILASHIMIALTWLKIIIYFLMLSQKKICEITCVMDVTQKDRYFGETIHFRKTLNFKVQCKKLDIHLM